ncbi:hypothetical protein CDL15_Pgr001040 [Punica granatum]|uniref:Uncharacterized protein n=1 Tax=Punica granatum TaxID=22663 RepID=A0A218X0R9_PUNGR|nr:hypothetical protein CDL15_Pgr001040 [Punica granatum]
MHGRWLSTPKKPPEVAVVVVLQEVTRIDPICKTKSEEMSKMIGGIGPKTQKPVLLRLDDRSEVIRFCRLFAPLRAVLLVLACFVLWAKRLTRRPRLEIDNRRRHRNPRTGLSQCFPSILMYSEIAVISICQKRVPKTCREAFVTIETPLGRPV